MRNDLVASVEAQHLIDLAEETLDYEKRRLLEVLDCEIFALEKKYRLENFRGYDFSFYIDRIDALEIDGKRVFMVWDYKNTNRTDLSANSLEGERPDEPQLLIYSLLIPYNLFSLGYFILSFKYGVRTRGVLIDRPRFYPFRHLKQLHFLEVRQKYIKRLFDDFLQGQAAVDPKKEATCSRCIYMPLCRINSMR